MNMLQNQPKLEAIARQLGREEGYRVLRAVPNRFSQMPEDGVPPDGRCIAILDTETSGLNVREDKLIELAIMLVWVDDDGEVTGHMGPVSWLQDPGVELEPEITLITGLANHHLVGKQIDDAAAFGFLDRADLLVAQNAKFDLAWIEQRYPKLKGKAWACSCSEIDWLKLGYEGRSQQHLLWQHGWFTNAHRAEADVWSLFWLLQQRQRGPGDSPVQTHLQRLLRSAETPTVLVEALRAPFSAKDKLKARAYHWDAGRRVWCKEMRDEDLPAERSWFRTEGLPLFGAKTMTANERHR